METLKRQLAAKYIPRSEVIGVIAYHNDTGVGSLTDRNDLILLVISEQADNGQDLFHYIREGIRIQERILSPDQLEKWAFQGENRDIISWILQGEILLDRDTYLGEFRHRLLEFPEHLKERKLLNEFSLFIRTYLQGKEFWNHHQYFESFGNIVQSLHHWARIAVMEEGLHPDATVWQQVKKMNPGVHKLYEELMSSAESLDKRLELVLLACEFSLVSKIESCCRLLIRILESRKGVPWSINELKDLPDLHGLHINLPLLMSKLVQKSLVKEVVVPLDESFDVLELRYTR